MQVALKDLELRGAGNLLGAEQAGHIAGVGFDLYLRMIGEAVATFRGDEVEGPAELRLELPVQARIPESYIDSERLRLEAYQKLSAAASVTAKDDAIDLVHRRAARPLRRCRPPTSRASSPSRGCAGARRGRVSSDVVAMGPNLRIAPAHLPDSMRVRLQRLYPKAKLLSRWRGARRAAADGRAANALGDADLIAWVGQLLDQLWPVKAGRGAGPG